MILLFYASVVLQSGLLAFDEFIFHWRRDLPQWERWGHPLDTLTTLLAIFILWGQGPGVLSITAAVISCLFVTKDEWIHAELCTGAEQWLHALLFGVHPVVLYLAHITWGAWGLEIPSLYAVALLYQTLYWNFYADRAFPRRS